MIDVLIKLNDAKTVPTYSSEHAAAFDLRAIDYGNVWPGETVSVDLGFATKIPEGYCVLALPRSGLGAKGIILANSVGLIDSDYTGTWKCFLRNEGPQEFRFEKGDRICQGLLIKHETANFVVADELPETVRGAGGFGSTGVK